MIGFFNCNKPRFVSSGYVVNKIKKATKEKCGHLGTLDPNATGVLPIAIGKATRFFDYFLKKDKIYKAKCKFGVLTTTLDEEGEVLQTEDVDISFLQINEKINQLSGKIMQTPPIYSAISINGKRAYEYAKNNQEIELNPRPVEVYEFKCIRQVEKNVFEFFIHCSAGTYVRSLLLDLAKLLGTISTTIEIDRQKSGTFLLENAHTLDEICENPERCLLSVESVLPNVAVVYITAKQLKNLCDGKMVPQNDLPDEEFLVKYGDNIVCLAENVDGCIKSKIYLYTEEK